MNVEIGLQFMVRFKKPDYEYGKPQKMFEKNWGKTLQRINPTRNREAKVQITEIYHEDNGVDGYRIAIFIRYGEDINTTRTQIDVDP